MIKIIEKSIDELIPYENNARINDKAVDVVANSIKEFGFKNPIIIDKDGVIVAGHTRVEACKKLGIDKVPCIIADDLTEEQIKAFRIADNSSAQVAEWDMEKLMAELETIDLDMTMFGLDEQIKDIEKQFAKEIIEDEVETDNIPKRTETGDIWKLGNHYLGCGDSTDFLWLKTLMQGKKADLVFTDPPYGMKKEKDGVANDNLNYDDLLEFNKQWIPLTFDLLKDNGSWYCWGIDEPLMDIYSNILKPMMRENKITFRNLITWDKGNGQGQLSADFRMYPIADEKCLFVMVGQQHLSETQDKWTGEFDWLLNYINTELNKIGLKRGKQYEAFMGSTNKSQHHLSKSHFGLMQKEDYLKLQAEANRQGVKAFEREYEDIKREYYANRAYFDNTHDNQNNVWHFDRVGKDEREHTGGHATPKPIALCSRAIKSSSREGEIVLDVFGGSGSTLIACEQLNRVCYANELDPHWCDVTINRWETLTGEKAVRL